MKNRSFLSDYEILTVIVNYGMGSKILRVAKENGVEGGTILIGHGTYRQPVLEFLELADIRKEVILMIVSQAHAYEILEKLNEVFKFYKKNHGIAYTIPLLNVIGSRKYPELNEVKKTGGSNMTTYQAIYTVVDRGRGSIVVDAANKAGAKGATIVNARGSDVHEVKKVFSMEIEEEKEMVLILAKTEEVKAIIKNIKEAIHVDKPGSGIMFVQEVHQVYGVRE